MWLLVGEHDKSDKVMAYNKMFHKREGFPLYIIEGAAHNANDDQPQRINELLQAFLQTLYNVKQLAQIDQCHFF